MNKEYIERNALINDVEESMRKNAHKDHWIWKTHDNEHQHFINMIYKQEVVTEVAEKPAGTWKPLPFHMFYCSECLEVKTFKRKWLYKYCPDCGTEMTNGGPLSNA